MFIDTLHTKDREMIEFLPLKLTGFGTYSGKALDYMIE